MGPALQQYARSLMSEICSLAALTGTPHGMKVTVTVVSCPAGCQRVDFTEYLIRVVFRMLTGVE